MDYETGKRLLRLDAIERRAHGYLERAIDAKDQPRASRAARLIEMAHDRTNTIVFASVTPYTDF